MSRNKNAVAISEMLDIAYTHALRLVREVIGPDMGFDDIALACREMLEKESKRTRRSGVLPKEAGVVGCLDCSASESAYGNGSPIVLKHDPECPQREHPHDHGDYGDVN